MLSSFEDGARDQYSSLRQCNWNVIRLQIIYASAVLNI